MLFIHIVKINTVLEEFDWLTKNDLSIEIVYGSEIRTTTTKWNTDNPIWNEAFVFKYLPTIPTITIKIIEDNTLFITEKKVVETFNISVKYDAINLIQLQGIEFYMGNIHYQKNKEINELTGENEEANAIMAERQIAIQKYTKLTKGLTRCKLELELKVKSLGNKLRDIRYIANDKI